MILRMMVLDIHGDLVVVTGIVYFSCVSYFSIGCIFMQDTPLRLQLNSEGVSFDA